MSPVASAEGDKALYMVALWLSSSGDCARRLVRPPGPTTVKPSAPVAAGSGLSRAPAPLLDGARSGLARVSPSV
eukprot:3335413-Amphidinium_carterae.1